MDIYWGGQALFKLKGKNASVIIDPYDPEMMGFKLPKDFTGDMVLVSHSHPDHNNSGVITTSTGEKPMVFTEPGEYEIAGAVVTAIDSFHDDVQGLERGKNSIFHIMMDGLNIVHLGDLGQSQLTEEQIGEIGEVDILLTPVGGNYTIDGKKAASIAAQLEPSIIIPMHFSIEGSKVQLDGVETFLKEMGAEAVTPVPKLSITKEKLPEEPQVVVLSKS